MSITHAHQLINKANTTDPSIVSAGDWNANHVLSWGLLQNNPSYIITNSGGVYDAVNGNTSVIDYTGSGAIAVIQSAINALTSGGTVFLKNGVYNLLSRTQDPALANIYYCIAMKPGIRFMGESTTGTILFLGSGLQANILLGDGISGGTGPADNCEISYMTLDGNVANQTDAGTDGNQCGIYMDRSVRVTYRNLIVQKTMHQGIYDSFSSGTLAEHLYFLGTGYEGLSVSACKFGTYHDIVCDTCGSGAVAAGFIYNTGFYPSGNDRGNVFSKIVSVNSPGYGMGIQSDGNTDDFQGNTFVGITLIGANNTGLAVGGTSAAHVNGNTFLGVEIVACGNQGVALTNANDNKFYGVRVSDCSGTALNISSSQRNFFYGFEALISGGGVFQDGINENTFPGQQASTGNMMIGGDFSRWSGRGQKLDITTSGGTPIAVVDVRGINPIGSLATPFNVANGTIGLGGLSGAPSSGIVFTATQDFIIYSSGGTGSSITTKDGQGNVMDSALTSGMNRYLLQGGQTITWGPVSGSAANVQVFLP